MGALRGGDYGTGGRALVQEEGEVDSRSQGVLKHLRQEDGPGLCLCYNNMVELLEGQQFNHLIDSLFGGAEPLGRLVFEVLAHHMGGHW